MERPSELSRYQASLEQLRSAARWLMAAAGATGAALVAGLQLTQVSNLQPVPAIVSCVGVGASLTAVLVLLVGAAKVLAEPRPAATEISNTEIAALTSGATALETPSDPLLKWIQEHRTYLLGTASTVTELYTDGFMNAVNVLAELDAGTAKTWRGQERKPGDDADREKVAAAIITAQTQLAMLEDGAHYWATARAYAKLLGHFRTGAIFFVAGILVFVLTPVFTAGPRQVPITSPLPVRVAVTDATLAHWPGGCPNRQDGVAVAGTLEHPEVVLGATQHCPARQIEAGDGLIVIPKIQAPTR